MREKQVVTFFEKKVTKKTFAPLCAVLKTPQSSGQKFFAALFFKKARTCL